MEPLEDLKNGYEGLLHCTRLFIQIGLAMVYKIYMFIFNFLAKESCPNGSPLQNGKCPDFVCVDRSSCSDNGNCKIGQTGCDCDEGFSGNDCSFNLGETPLSGTLK